MNNKIEPKVLKGFTDYLPKEAKARQILFRTIEQVFERFGFMPMYTPALEYKEILLNKYGDDEKLVYSFTDNCGREVALRYDLTVPLARFVALHQNEITIPFKRYQIAPVWRAENTQRGRLREFYQCDVDIVGSETVLSDAEIIACLCFVLDEIGVTNYQARINDRGIFNVISDVLKLSLEDNVHMLRSIDKYYKIGVDGVIAELEKYNFSIS
jgi:histidyl-tRNA synthetase